MLFWPILSYITYGVLSLKSIVVYYSAISIFYGIFFIFHSRLIHKKIFIPKELYYFLVFIIFLFIWSYFNGSMNRRGVISVILNNPYLASFFIMLIIYNTKYNDSIIQRSIKIFKITVIIAAIVSVIQVFDSHFFNAFFYEHRDLDVYRRGLYNTRRASIFGFINLNSLGLSFIPIISIVSGYLLRYRDKKYLIFLLLGGLIAFLSNTRYVMISFLIITLQIIIYRKDALVGFIKYISIAFILIITILIFFEFIGYDLMTWYSTRLFAEGAFQETSRYKAFINFLRFFPENYLFGNGNILSEDVVEASMQYGSSHIHIGYLSHLVAYGIVGCFFLFGFWYHLLMKFYKTAKRTNYWGSVFAFITFLWAFATFSNSSIFFYGIIYTFIFDKYFRDLHYKKIKFQKPKIIKARKEEKIYLTT